MKVELEDYMPNCEEDLNTIASQSRNEKPKNVDGLFKNTKTWGHDTIQEFAVYTFHVEGVSLNLLKQLTRHRIATYNVMSHRHVEPSKVVMPKGIKGMSGVIELEDGSEVKWDTYYKTGKFYANWVDKDGITWDLEECPIPLEDIRYGFPCGVTTNLYMKFDGRSLRNFLRLRMDKHAQWEIRELANAVKGLVENVHPFMVNDL